MKLQTLSNYAIDKLFGLKKMANKFKNELAAFPAEWDAIEKLLAILPGNIYWKDVNGRYLGCNDAQAKALGFSSSDELIGKTSSDLHLKTGGNIQSTDNLVMLTGVGVSLEEAGEQGQTYLAKKIPLKNKDGEVIGLLGISFDITERKQKEHSLTKKNKQVQLTLDNILSNLPGHVFWLDEEGIVLGCNNLQAQSLGLSSAKELLGKTMFDIFSKEEAEAITKTNQNVMAAGSIVTVEEESSNADGKKAIFLSKKVPMRDDQGNIVGLLGISFDMTSVKQAEKLQIEHAISEEKAQAMKMLAATIAHELRTPLASISALSSAIQIFLPVLIEGYELAEQNNLPVSPLSMAQIEALKTLPEDFNQIINAANTFINMLLAKVNLEKAKPTHLVALSAAQCVEKALKQYPFNNGGQHLIKWDPANDFSYKGDELLSTYLLFNLLKNAIYYVTAAGKGDIKIWLEKGTEHNILHFRDSGTGIPSDILPHIFEQFYSKTYHGTGVGLAFCKMVMDAYNGHIKCESTEGDFTHFMLLFPAIQEK
ncbi:MAG: sensor histidine kinase [Gammaproteobacteria bacterium]|nr:sensor histidine kinase [Gammaproteobacteria bacterium]